MEIPGQAREDNKRAELSIYQKTRTGEVPMRAGVVWGWMNF